jgi:hypothetical protein
MTWTMMLVGCLVVPGWSGVETLDRTGTTRGAIGADVQEVRKNTAPATAGARVAERAGFESAN